MRPAGIEFKHVEVSTGRLRVGESGGFVLRAGKSEDFDREVLTALAGTVAEAIVRKAALHKVSKCGTSQDYLDTWDLYFEAM